MDITPQTFLQIGDARFPVVFTSGAPFVTLQVDDRTERLDVIKLPENVRAATGFTTADGMVINFFAPHNPFLRPSASATSPYKIPFQVKENHALVPPPDGRIDCRIGLMVDGAANPSVWTNAWQVVNVLRNMGFEIIDRQQEWHPNGKLRQLLGATPKEEVNDLLLELLRSHTVEVNGRLEPGVNVQDDDSHWYFIPVSLKDEFRKMAAEGEADEWVAFNDRFGEYATGGAPHS